MCYFEGETDIKWHDYPQEEPAYDHLYIVSDGKNFAMCSYYFEDGESFWNSYCDNEKIPCESIYGGLEIGDSNTFSVEKIVKWFPIPHLPKVT